MCEKLEPNANCSSFGDVLSMLEIHMIATYNLTTCVFLIHVRNIGMESDDLVPFLHAL